jgi:hypothetical protein
MRHHQTNPRFIRPASVVANQLVLRVCSVEAIFILQRCLAPTNLPHHILHRLQVMKQICHTNQSRRNNRKSRLQSAGRSSAIRQERGWRLVVAAAAVVVVREDREEVSI